MKKMNKRGFTIVELSIVIAVIAILSAVLIPTFTSIVNNSKESAAIQEATNAHTLYLGDFDYNNANGNEPAENLIFAADNGKFVVVYKDGEKVNKVVDSELAAVQEFDATVTDATVAAEWTTPIENVEGIEDDTLFVVAEPAAANP